MCNGFNYLILLCFVFLGTTCGDRYANEVKQELSKQACIEGRFVQEYELTKNPTTGEVPRQNLWKIAEKMAIQDALKSTNSLQWTECGPNNVGGRTRALLVDAQDLSGHTIWAGGISGGLWKTEDITDSNPTWNKVDDLLDNLAVSTLAQDVANPSIMYFGTGEGWSGGNAIRGLGIFKTIDGGVSWQQLASTNNTDFYFVQKLIIDANGHLFAATRAGLQLSTNGGMSWTQVLGATVGIGDSDWMADLELAANGDLYATLGIHSKGEIWKADFATHNNNTGGLGTWTNISPAGTYRRTELAVAPSDPNYVYAICQSNTSGDVSYFYHSTDAGISWTAKPLAAWGNQTWYNLILAVDPNDPNRIHAGGTPAFISNDGGDTWLLSYFGVHVDFHNIQFINGSSSEMICGNDGGVYYSNNGDQNSPTFLAKNSGYNITQFYSCAVHPERTENYFLAGSQDNGTQKIQGEGLQAGVLVTSGDGGFCHIDEENPAIQFSSFLYNNHNRSTDGGQTFQPVIQNNSGSFINASDYDNTAKKLYAGNQAGQYFRWNDPATGTDFENVSVSLFLGATVTQVLVSPNVPNRVYFGLNNGNLVFVDQANSDLNKVGNLIKSGVAGASVSGISIEKGNEDHILLSYSNYGVESVWESFNATTGNPTWTSVEGNLPDMPIRWCVFSPHDANQAVLATELGVWKTDQLNGSATIWNPANTGLANVRVDMLQFRKSDSLLVAATHGRGLFTTNFFSKMTIGFSTENSVVEEGNFTQTQNACQAYKELLLPIKISKNPTNNFSITVQVKPESTAQLGRDFLLENSSLIFTNGGSMEQNVVLKIFDDAYAEILETIVLELTSDNPNHLLEIPEHSITVLDNDPEPTTGKREETYTFGTGNFNFSFAPFRGLSEDQKAEFILLHSEMSQENLTAGAIKSLAFEVQSKNSAFPYQDFTVSAKNSTDTAADNAFETGMTAVFQEDLTTELGWNTLDFSTPFSWDGSSNLVFQTCFDNDQSSSNDAVLATVLGFNASEFDFKNGEVGCSLNQPAGSFSLRPNLQLTMEQDIKVGDAAAVSESHWLTVGETAHFYATSGKIIASVKQLSGTDMGCVSMTIDKYGTGQATADWVDGMLAEKTFFLEIDNPQPYELTLYFSATELAIWGNEKMELNLLQSDNSIQAAEITNSTIHSKSQLTATTYGAVSNVYYQGIFNESGGFVLTNAESLTALPLELLHFSGEKTKEGHLLTWQTTFEENTDFFLLEKSEDGRDFQELAIIEAAGFSEASEAYEYLDTQPFLGKNYYRLQSIDRDGTATTHPIVAITATISTENTFQVYPNILVQEKLHVNFVANDGGEAIFSIVNTSGKLVFQQTLFLRKGTNNYHIDNLILASGSYYATIQTAGVIYANKVIVF